MFRKVLMSMLFTNGFIMHSEVKSIWYDKIKSVYLLFFISKYKWLIFEVQMVDFRNTNEFSKYKRIFKIQMINFQNTND